MNKVSTSYLLWLACFFNVCGLQRFYNKKYFTGFLWLCTFGLLGFGQLMDLFFMRQMVEEHNLKEMARLGMSPDGVPFTMPAITLTMPQPQPSAEDLMVKLVKAAAARNGKISVTQAVLDTGASFVEVEATLKEMFRSGYVRLDNHPITGVVIYEFLEL